MKLSLRSRWALWAALATGLAVVAVSAGLFFSVSGLLRQAQYDRATLAAQDAGARLQDLIRQRQRHEERDDDDPIAFLTGQVRVSSQDLEGISRQLGQAGLQLRLSVRRGDGWNSIQTGQFPAGLPVLAPGTYEQGDWLLVVQPLRGGDLLSVVQDAQVLGTARRAFGRALTLLLPLALLLSLALGWWVAGRLLRPVAALEGAARAIGEGGDLRQPLPFAGDGDELARLSLTLGQSFSRLADAREREQGFLRAAAHDLRSPLAALQARVGGTLAQQRTPERYQADLREIGHDLTRLSTLANHLLLLARDPSALSRSGVPLRDLAADAVDRARELDPLADVDLLPSPALTVQGDRVLLGQALWNLTANAVRHAPGATVTVRLSAAGGEVRVTVEDDGAGVSPDVLAQLGQAFYRPSESRSGEGHGLGLALARHVAALHGGRLELHSEEGRGFRAELVLPE